jgi:hypothetical protein
MEGRGSLKSFSKFDEKKVRFRGFVKEPLRETHNSIYPWVKD